MFESTVWFEVMLLSSATRSSLELMLDKIQRREKEQSDLPPPLPIRPASKARLPRGRRLLPINIDSDSFIQQNYKIKEGRRFDGLIIGQNGDSSSNSGFLGSKTMKTESSYIDLSEDYNHEEMNKECGEALTNESGGRDKWNYVRREKDILEDARHKTLQSVVRIQKCFRGHQARCYYHKLMREIVTLQSFVRGENARREYQSLSIRKRAILVIQKHMRKRIEWKTLRNRERAVTCLQSAVRGWVTRRNLTYMKKLENSRIEDTKTMRKPDRKSHESEELVQVPYSVFVDLQSRLLKAEAAVKETEEENEVLKQQIQQYKEKWSDYEAKMKSMEVMWQNQLTSLQMSLAAARKSLAAKDNAAQTAITGSSPLRQCNTAETTRATNGTSPISFSIPTPNFLEERDFNEGLNSTIQLIKEFEERKKMFDDDAHFLMELRSQKVISTINPNEELRQLKLGFETWKRDYKIRLRETKAAFQKLRKIETEKDRKRWWAKMNPRHMGCRAS